MSGDIAPRPADLRWVRRYRNLLVRERDTLCRVVADELGKPEFETLTSELIPLLAACKWAEKRAGRVLRERRVPGAGVLGGVFQIGQHHRVVRAPLGDVAIVATWNYPIQLLGVQLVHAIVGGNRVWVKPSERSPESQNLLLDLAERSMREAGLDADRLVRTGADREAGERLLADRRFDHVVFTGSTEVGRSIARTLAETLTPSTLELSGSDSAIVLADADIRLAAESVAFGVRLNAGQTCMAPRRVLVQDGVRDAFVRSLADAFERDPIRTAARADELERAQRVAREAVGEAGGEWILGEGGTPPFVVGGCSRESDLFLGNHFGPALAVVGVSSLDDALRAHGAVPKKLATAVFSRDTKKARAIAARLGSTVVTINDCVVPTGHPGLGIGGIGDSGWGVSRGAAGLLSMTRPVFVSRTGRRVRTPVSEPSEGVKSRIARFAAWLYG